MKERFSSRKFLCAILNTIINFTVILCTESQSVELAAWGMSCVGLVMFIICESVIDCSNIDSSVIYHHYVHREDEDGVDDKQEGD